MATQPIPAAGAASPSGCRGAWLCAAAMLLFWVTTLSPWLVSSGKFSYGLGGTLLERREGLDVTHVGTNYFPFGAWAGWLVFLGGAVWLVLPRLRREALPPAPSWVPAAALAYGFWTLANAVMEYNHLEAQSRTVQGISSRAWTLAPFIGFGFLLLLLGGSLVYALSGRGRQE